MALFTARARAAKGQVKFTLRLSDGQMHGRISGRPIGWQVDYIKREITINATMSGEDRLLALMHADRAICDYLAQQQA